MLFPERHFPFGLGPEDGLHCTMVMILPLGAMRSFQLKLQRAVQSYHSYVC